MPSRRSKKEEFPAWHPDFRISEDLPDIKAVRTDFLINIGAVTFAALLIFWLFYRELSIAGLTSELDQLVEVREQLEPDNRKAVGLNARFMKKKQLSDDIDRFYSAPFDVPRFFADIARIRPADILFEEISYREDISARGDHSVRVYRFDFRGQTRNLKTVDLFKDSFAELPYLDEMNVGIVEGANPRNAALNTFGFDLEVALEPDEGEEDGE